MERSSEQCAANALRAVGGLLRALGHQLRTPLGVVSNDLFFFQSLQPAGEFDRTLERCREISAIVQRLSEPFLREFKAARVSLSPLLSDFFPGLVVPGGIEVSGDVGALTFGFRELRALLEQHQEPQAEPRGTVERWPGGWLLRCAWSVGVAPQSHYASLTSLFCDALGRDLFAPGIVDLLFLAHGFDVDAFADRVEVRIRSVDHE